MKKAAIILICILIPAIVFAESYSSTAFGITIVGLKQTMYYDGESISSHLRGTQLSLSVESNIFDSSSSSGFALGITMYMPLDASVDGVDMATDFTNIGWTPHLGYAQKFIINDKLTMISSINYSLMMRFQSETESGITARLSSFLHGLYVEDMLAYQIGTNSIITAGLGIMFPIFGTAKLSATGYGSEQYKYFFTGVYFNPFIGFNIRR